MVVCRNPGHVAVPLKTVGLCRLAGATLEQADFETGEDYATGSRDDPGLSRGTTVDAFAYTEPGGRLELFTEPLEPSGIPGLFARRS